MATCCREHTVKDFTRGRAYSFTPIMARLRKRLFTNLMSNPAHLWNGTAKSGTWSVGTSSWKLQAREEYREIKTRRPIRYGQPVGITSRCSWASAMPLADGIFIVYQKRVTATMAHTAGIPSGRVYGI